MINLSEHHQSLLLGKITHSLTVGELEELEILLQHNPEVREAYEDLVSKIPVDLSETGFERIKKTEYWDDLTENFRHKSKKAKRVAIRWAAVAAIVTGLVIASFLYLADLKKPENQVSAVRPQYEKAIQLRLADGKVIDLSSQKGKITVGSTNIINDAESLTYSVSDKTGTGINSVMVPVGKNYKITLIDGSEIWMNSVTKLEFPFQFSENSREITLSGEAYCKIAKNSKWPFIVHLPTGTVTVLGTEFNVNSYNNHITKVSLVEGKVSVTSSNKTITISPGKQAVLANNELMQQAFNSKTVLSWRDGIFYLEEADINDISDVLERWYGVHVIIDNEIVYKKRFAGLIDRNLPLNTFLDDLKAIAKITGFFDKDGVLHFK